MMTILKNYKNQTQDFKKIDVIEPWTTRSEESGVASVVHPVDYSSLKRKLLVMTLEDIHQSAPCLSSYELSAFEKYYRDMLKLTGE